MDSLISLFPAPGGFVVLNARRRDRLVSVDLSISSTIAFPLPWRTLVEELDSEFWRKIKRGHLRLASSERKEYDYLWL